MSVSKRVHIICESCFFPKIIFERSLRDLGGIVEAGNFWEFAIFFICFYMFLVTFILDMRKLRPCHESCDIRDLQARLSEFDSRHATRQHWQQSRSFLGSMQILCVEVWHYMIIGYIQQTFHDFWCHEELRKSLLFILTSYSLTEIFRS